MLYFYRLQFLKLQTDLLEEFRQKIIDDSNENETNEYLIEMLCTLHYVTFILNNWGTNVVCKLLIIINFVKVIQYIYFFVFCINMKIVIHTYLNTGIFISIES